MAKIPVQFRLNGSDRAAFVGPSDNLLTLLRRGLNDFGPKYGCGQGTCGTCTVLVDGDLQLSCLTLAATCEGKHVETVSGMAEGPVLHPLQQAFMDHFAAQCGFCTPGMLTAAKALLTANPNPTRAEVIDGISGNICRCTGYDAIIEAILAAARGGQATRAY
ncbi:MAG: (2Fe-2S)-binding protein [Phreatobacter sp.]|uniref:(2Fe-2S)-binding protein n=1 Tax=Phreatobacter sp. TaxID=1966341 RepID=UPI002733EDD6|nr:(2Fe-2S)-binding protein [Phreatobacter sp.]MDP2801295.1 (2Fe-2S)-binding protein [Phreatobacter sp.]